MITLKTVPQATAQEVFDQITQHLLKQGKRSVSSTGACRYRTENSEGVLKCAAGCLIADEEYDRLFENVAWDGLVNDGKVPKQHAQLYFPYEKIKGLYKPLASPFEAPSKPRARARARI